MNQSLLPPVLRRWRYLVAVTGAIALAGGGVLFAASSDPATAMAFHGVTTTRVLDTREGSGTPLGLGGVLDLVVPRLPDDATGIAVNVTVVDGTEASFLTMYPTGDARPTTSTINWSSAAAVANSATVLVHSDHSVRLYNLKGSVNVVLDLIGYYSPAPVGGATGPAGPLGRQGLAGADGTDGVDGANGVVGPVGALGQRGAAGQDGVNGVDGKDATLVYLYAYNTPSETVLTGQAVTFSTAGLSEGGIVFAPGGSSFVVPASGVYRVTFGVIGLEETQISIQVNNSDQASGPLVFGGHGRNPNVGSGVLQLAGGDNVTIANLSSGALGDGVVTLEAHIGGTVPAINAWIDIQQLSG